MNRVFSGLLNNVKQTKKQKKYRKQILVYFGAILNFEEWIGQKKKKIVFFAFDVAIQYVEKSFSKETFLKFKRVIQTLLNGPFAKDLKINK